MISIRFALHAMVYLHCLTDLRFGLEKTMATVTYYLYTKKQRSLFNLCIKHIWDTMRRMQKDDRLLTPVFDDIQVLYMEWQKIVAKVILYNLVPPVRLNINR
jgi:predicted permease